MNVSDTNTTTITANDQHGLVGGTTSSPKTGAEAPQEVSNDKGCAGPHTIEGAGNTTGASDGTNNNVKMSTEDFLALRTGAQEEPFKVLDEVIARMKENMEEVGDAIEAIVKMTKETSEESVALQLLQNTAEAMDQNE